MTAPIDNTWDSGERELARILYCDEQPPRVPHEPSPDISGAIFDQLWTKPLATRPDCDETPNDVTVDSETTSGQHDLLAFLGVMWVAAAVLALAIWLVAR